MRSDHQRLDAVSGQILAGLLADSHLLRPDVLGRVLAAAAEPLGVSHARVYLADLQQTQLTALPDGAGEPAPALSIEASLAGRAYRLLRVEQVTVPDDPAVGQVWIPLLDGAERLGVLELRLSPVDEARLAWCRRLGSLAGLMIAAKRGYSDSFSRTERSRPMSLQAELAWAFLPPRTFATDWVLVSATLEPAYEVGGDAFDYSLEGDRLHVSIFDSVGHDLAAGLLASVGMAACRSTRRAGGTLSDIAARADHAISHQFGADRYVTALLCDLDTRTGQFAWIPCGHPPPLLIRGNKVVKQLTRRPQLPLGLAVLADRARRPRADERAARHRGQVYAEQLEAGDRVLLYTDGVTDGRAADGTPFGLTRLTDFVIRHSNEGLTAAETLRRLNRAITEYQDGRLFDDATIVLVEWRPADPRRQLVP